MSSPQYAEVLGLPLVHVGKVRELYALPGRDQLLMVATDNISAFDFVLGNQIPDKGVILTALSNWWCRRLADVVDNHLLAEPVPAVVTGRAVVCERLAMVPFECVARGYLTGSGWQEYLAHGTVCAIPLPAGLQDGSALPEPIFTPATKAELGAHDENVGYEVVQRALGGGRAARIRELTLAVYARAEEIARGRGLLLADTKLEFGVRPDGTLVLADEVLTPDSSRYWDAASWRPGGPLPSFDKQFVRDWLRHDSGWDPKSGEAPPPLPDEVVVATRERYVTAYERLTGQVFEAP